MPTIVALVGMQHCGTSVLVKSLPDGEPLTLVREPNNQHDRWAVQVWARGTMLGFIKGSQVRPVALAMDAKSEERRFAKLSTRNGERWPLVEIND